MRSVLALLVGALAYQHHHHHKHHHHRHQTEAATEAVTAAATTAAPATAEAPSKSPETEEEIVQRMSKLEKELSTQSAAVEGRLLVNGPLPTDFAAVFVGAVAQATGAEASSIKVLAVHEVNAPAPALLELGAAEVVEVVYEAPQEVVTAVDEQAADPASALATGALQEFLTEKEEETTPVAEKGIDIDTQLPYGELAPFGREDTASELTKASIKESDEMVDQLERAEVAEEKRAVFRALTRLRGAAITSFDGIARAQTGQMDEYNKVHHWRSTHPLHHLAQEESDVSRWAFPSAADF